MSPTSRLTVAEYERMIAEGRFNHFEEHALELINGEIVGRVRIRDEQAYVHGVLMDWSYEVWPNDTVKIGTRSAVSIPTIDSVAEPHLTWLRRRSYRHAHPGPDDVLLLVESAVMGLWYMRGTKARLYARAGIADYWIVNVPEEVVEVHREPSDGAYRSRTIYRPGESIPLLAFPEIALPVAMLFEDPDEEDETDLCGS